MTPRKRRTFLLGLAGCLAVLACVVFLAQDHSAINPANYERIQVGMPLAEVEAILGGPARDEATGPIVADENDDLDFLEWKVDIFRISYDWTLLNATKDVQRWNSDRLMIRVEPDEQRRVAGKARLEVRRVQESPWQKVRRWLRV